MPAKVSDYSKSSIYKLCCNDTAITDVYVGSTTAFSKRKYGHKSYCNNARGKAHNLYVYQFIRANGGWDNWSMILVEDYNATDKRNLELRERYWLDTLQATLNKQVPTRSRQEWCEENQESLKYSQKKYRDGNRVHLQKYRDEHKDDRQEYDKSYREKNKDKINQWQKNYRDEHKEKEKERNKIYRAKQFARKVHEFIYS